MSKYDQESWEARWVTALETHGDRLPPASALVTTELDGLEPGRALDAGCGHGSDALWLAARGWTVTALDFAAPALDHARSTAAALGEDVAARTTWIQADLGTWVPEPGAYDLVVCLFVHIAGDAGAFVARMAAGVAPGGTLLLAGHHPIEQTQVTLEAARAALDPGTWALRIAEDRPRERGGYDAVVCATRSASSTITPSGPRT